MIAHNAVNARDFVYCSVYQGPFETTVYHNKDAGNFHAFIYIVAGNIDTYPSDTPTLGPEAVNAPLSKGNIYDITHTQGKYVISNTGEEGAAMVMFNPVPADKHLNIEIVEGPITKEVAGKTTIVCITGPAKVNGKEVGSMMFAKVASDTSATLVLNEHGVVALVS